MAGWAQSAYADPGALARPAPGCAERTVLLSPFDSLIWYRERLERLFDVRHRLEAYTPKEKRVYGYFAMPVLEGARWWAWSTRPAQGRTLIALAEADLWTRPRAAEPMARALTEAAAWVGCDNVALEQVSPPALRSRRRLP